MRATLLFALTLALASPALADDQESVQGKRIAEGQIKSFNYIVDVVDGRAVYAKLNPKPNATHHLAILVMDLKARQPVEGVTATVKMTAPNGKSENWTLKYDPNTKHSGRDLNLSQAGKYTFDGFILLGNEKKPFKSTYTCEK